MAASQSAALKHWARIIQRWPVDKVRPENVSFQKNMQKRIQGATSAVTSVEANEAPAKSATFEPRKEMRQLNALYSLLEDRFTKQYPVPGNLRHPASNPSHYDDLIRELEEAPGRSWFGSMAKRIKGSLRFT